MGVVSEEADESLGWLELIDQLGDGDRKELAWLLREVRQLVAIFGSAYHTAKANEQRRKLTKKQARPSPGD